MDEPGAVHSGETHVTDQIDLRAGAIDVVEAEKVTISQGGAYQIAASEVVLSQGAAGIVEADTAMIQDAIALSVRGDVVSAESSTVALAVGEDVLLNDVRAGVVLADSVKAERSSTVVLISREVHGSVETVLDARGAALAGIVAGVAVGIVLLAGNLLSRRTD